MRNSTASPDGASTLLLAEAVDLCHALVDWVAESLEIRVIFIKGPISGLQGLRRPKVSGDVDVLVSPADLDPLIKGLNSRGWTQRPTDFDESTFPVHSVTLLHPTWPNDIDVHFRFPGMERPATECFELLWSRTATFPLAGRPLKAPSRELGICILALHALRSPWLEDSKAELAFLESITTSDMLPVILAVSEELMCRGALHPFLTAAFGPSYASDPPPPSEEWRRRIAARSLGSARLIALLEGPWRARPAMLYQALNPSREALLAYDLYADVSFRGRLRITVERWKNLVKGLPRTVTEVFDYLTDKR